jgi:hypothetical protein
MPKHSTLLTKVRLPTEDIRRYICRRTPLVFQSIILTTQMLPQAEVGDGDTACAAI